MSAPKLLADLETSVSNATTVQASAALLIRGIPTRLQTAVDAALANGATEKELAPVQAEIDALNLAATDLADAVVKNTPAA